MNSNCSVLVGKGKPVSSSSSSPGLIKAGTLILTCKPFAYTLNNNLTNTHCDTCFKTPACAGHGYVAADSSNDKVSLFRCSGCQLVRYCDKSCQKTGWENGHKYECKPMKIHGRPPPPFVRLVLRVIIKIQSKTDICDKISEKHYRRFRDLMSHYNDVKQDKTRVEHVLTVEKVLESILRHQKALTMPNETELMAICGRIYVNTFRITNNELMGLGTGLYLGASIFDHSCDPMAVVSFNSVDIHVRNIVDLQANFPVEKITISYQDTIRPTRIRVPDLKNIYYFECQCNMCTLKEFDLPMNAIKCPNSACNTEVNLCMAECPKCKEKLEESFVAKINEIEELAQFKLDEMREVAYVDVCNSCLQLMSKNYFSETHWLQTSMASAAFDAATDLKLWDQALSHGKLALLGYRKYLSENHPFLGIVLLKLAKLCWFLEKEAEAKEYVVEAKKVLDITHGESSAVHLQDLNPLLYEISQATQESLF